MTKLHKIAAAFLLVAVLLLSGCAEQGNSPTQEPENTSSNSNLSDSTETSYSTNSDSTLTDSETSVSSDDPESSTNSESEPDLKAFINDFQVDSITAPDGSQVNKSDAVYATGTIGGPVWLGFDFSYIRYSQSVFYSTFDDPDLINWEFSDLVPGDFNIDIYDLIEDPKFLKIKAGDILENGLIVKSAEWWVDSAGFPNSYNVDFDGEITLEGIFHCSSKKDSGDDGYLSFFVDNSQSVFPVLSRDDVAVVSIDIVNKVAIVNDSEEIRLGHVDDIAYDISNIIHFGEYIKAKITLKDISINWYDHFHPVNNATLVSVEPIT
ncbi:MAG: hypothetical protein K2N56_05315 [Oscillospiraceae bacterium]|nr:hypothetical protein [Oscillospiraceae bacterium]